MSRCVHCGMPVEFRYIEGRCIPLHTIGGCSGVSQNDRREEIKNSLDSECRKTFCPKCRSAVYFIRHNGGSVWVEPPLGPPWEKHPCFVEDKRERGSALWVSTELISQIRSQKILITGVVRRIEVYKEKKVSVVEIVIENDEKIALSLRGGSAYLLGNIVVVSPENLTVYLAAEPRICFKIVAALKRRGTLAMRGQSYGLPLGPDMVPKADKERRLLEKYHSQGLNGDWKYKDLLSLVVMLRGRDRDRIIHKLAVEILEHAETYGDCGKAADLILVAPTAKRQRLVNWLWEHSPIKVNLSQKRPRVRLAMSVGGERRPFRTAAARVTPI